MTKVHRIKLTGKSIASSGKVSKTLISAMLLFCLATISNAQKYQFFSNTISDWAVLTFPTAGGSVRWSLLKNANPSPPGPGQATIADITWGLTQTDLIPNVGDYTGDGIDDTAIYRNNSGTPANTYIWRNQNGGATYVPWGISTTDILGKEGDYDGDGKMDPTIVRQSGANLVWWVYRSSDNTSMTFTYGLFDTDIALPGADYTGDGKDDPAIVRIGANGLITWYVGTTSGTVLSVTPWGSFNTDFIIPGGDYDGDGKADFMVWRGFGAGTNGAWYLRTNSGNTSATVFGIPGASGRDTPLRAGDYEGDGKTDIAVYRPSSLTFWVARSSGGVQSQRWGVTGNTNIPVASFGTF